MGDFNRNRDRRPGGGGFRPRFNDRGSNRGPVEMHSAICNNCGKECQVPFQPTSGKPVYCSNCFSEKRGFDARRLEGRTPQRPHFEENRPINTGISKDQLEALNSKLDKILQLLTPAAPEEKTVVAEPVAPVVDEEKPKKKKKVSKKEVAV